MSSLLIHNIGLLVGAHAEPRVLKGAALKNLPTVADAWLLITEGPGTAAR